MTYTFGVETKRGILRVVWDFGDGTAIASRYPDGKHRHRYIFGSRECIDRGTPYCPDGPA